MRGQRVQTTRPDKKEGDIESICVNKLTKQMGLEQFDKRYRRGWRIISRCTNKHTNKL